MISSGYLELANFFAGFNIHEGMRHAYRSLEVILKKDHSCQAFAAVSFPTNDQNVSNKLRVLWGKEDFQDAEFKALIRKEIFDKNIVESEESFMTACEEGKHYCFVFTGKEVNQARWLILEFNDSISNEFISLLSTFFHKCCVGEEKYNEIRRVENLVYVDDVTGLFNQRKLLIDIEKSIEHYAKHKESFSVLFMDIDHFKKVNDSHGHMVGTKALELMGKFLKDAFRENDLLYRYGGDEFVAIIPHIDKDSALSLANRVLNSIKKYKFALNLNDNDLELSLSVSIGVALYPEDANSRQDILSIADTMMYQAKESGRGKVCLTKDLIA